MMIVMSEAGSRSENVLVDDYDAVVDVDTK